MGRKLMEAAGESKADAVVVEADVSTAPLVAVAVADGKDGEIPSVVVGGSDIVVATIVVIDVDDG